MCTVVRVITDDDEVDCETLGELAEALGMGAHWMLLDGPGNKDEDDCLCPVNMASLNASAAPDDAASYHYVIDRRSSDQGRHNPPTPR